MSSLFAWGYNNAASDIDSRLPPTLEVISCSMTSCIKYTKRCIQKIPKNLANDIKIDIKPCQPVTSIALLLAGYHQHKNLSPVNQLGQANIQYKYDKANIERISNLKEILKPVIVWYKNDIEPDIPVTSIAGYHQHKNLSPVNQLAKANIQCI